MEIAPLTILCQLFLKERGFDTENWYIRKTLPLTRNLPSFQGHSPTIPLKGFVIHCLHGDFDGCMKDHPVKADDRVYLWKRTLDLSNTLCFKGCRAYHRGPGRRIHDICQDCRPVLLLPEHTEHQEDSLNPVESLSFEEARLRWLETSHDPTPISTLPLFGQDDTRPEKRQRCLFGHPQPGEFVPTNQQPAAPLFGSLPEPGGATDPSRQPAAAHWIH